MTSWQISIRGTRLKNWRGCKTRSARTTHSSPAALRHTHRQHHEATKKKEKSKKAQKKQRETPKASSLFENQPKKINRNTSTNLSSVISDTLGQVRGHTNRRRLGEAGRTHVGLLGCLLTYRAASNGFECHCSVTFSIQKRILYFACTIGVLEREASKAIGYWDEDKHSSLTSYTINRNKIQNSRRQKQYSSG